MFYSTYHNKDLLQHLSKSPYPVAQYGQFAMALDSHGMQYIFYDVTAFDLQTTLLKLSGADSALLPTPGHWLSVIIDPAHANTQLLCSTCDHPAVHTIEIFSKSHEDNEFIPFILSIYHGEQANIYFLAKAEYNDNFYSRKFFLNAAQAQKLLATLHEQKELYQEGKLLYATLDGLLDAHGKNCFTFSAEVYKMAGFHGSIADYWSQPDIDHYLHKGYPTGMVLHTMKSSSWISLIKGLIPSIVTLTSDIYRCSKIDTQLERSIIICNVIKELFDFNDLVISCQQNGTIGRCLYNTVSGVKHTLEPYDDNNMLVELKDYQCIIPMESFDNCLI